MSGNNTISSYLEIMKSLYTPILVFISLSTSAQIKGYGHFGRTFFTKGDISGRIMSIGISKSNKINSLGYYVDYSKYHSTINTGLSTGIITNYPVSTIAYPYCSGIGYIGDARDDIKNLGLIPLPSSPLNIHIESIAVGVVYPVLKKESFNLEISLGCSLARIDETWKDLELTISNGTNPIVEIPQNFVLIQTASAEYLDVGAKSAMNFKYYITSKSSIDLQLSNLKFVSSGQMNWDIVIGMTSLL